MIAEGGLATVDQALMIRGNRDASFYHVARTQAFADDDFADQAVEGFAAVQLSESSRWTLKDDDFRFLLELPHGLGTPLIVPNLDRSLARASIITLPEGTVSLWGFAITVESENGTVTFARGNPIEVSGATYERLAEPTFTPMTTRPALLNQEEAVDAIVLAYPSFMKSAGIGGVVVVWLFIDKNGAVRDARVGTTSGQRTLDDGGGAFSGKDPTKVDRSGAYAARYVAKNLVAAGLADRVEVIVSYAIGIARPISVSVETFDTNHVDNQSINDLVNKHFDLRPAAIISDLNLRRPIYRQTAAYGHFGRDDLDLPWEQTDKAALLRQEAGL